MDDDEWSTLRAAFKPEAHKDTPVKWRVMCDLCSWRMTELDNRIEAKTEGYKHVAECEFSNDGYEFRVQGYQR